MTALHVSSNAAMQLSEKERRTITPSIQQFELGESSRGQRLLERGQRFGSSVNDPLFAGALEMFIKEEQQHSRYLEAFMDSQSIPASAKTLGRYDFSQFARPRGTGIVSYGSGNRGTHRRTLLSSVARRHRFPDIKNDLQQDSRR